MREYTLRDSSTRGVVRVSSFMDSRLSVKYGQKVKVHHGCVAHMHTCCIILVCVSAIDIDDDTREMIAKFKRSDVT